MSTMNMPSHDRPILVIGLGPAGSAAAIFLAQKGLKVLAIDTQLNKDLRIGESLPPNSKILLQELGLWQNFKNGPHKISYGNQSYWGDDIAEHSDFLHHPQGNGWHIDRPAFEAMLVDHARQLGVDILDHTKILSADRHYPDNIHGYSRTQGWDVILKSDGIEHQIQCSFIVDASGRNSFLARRQGAERLYEDDQLALVAFLHSECEFQMPATSLIETTEDGWWYSAKIPNNRVATAFMCAPGKDRRKQWIDADNWWQLMARSKRTSERINPLKMSLIADPRFVAADSSILDSIVGNGWLAVGDAAMTYDPLAAHGILMAMVTARHAARSIGDLFKGKRDTLEDYERTLYWAFREYVVERQQYYDAERRFTNSVYWQARSRTSNHYKGESEQKARSYSHAQSMKSQHTL
jgi:flavin-dependent dehydrogenase